jgi:hypothetical protein
MDRSCSIKLRRGSILEREREKLAALLQAALRALFGFTVNISHGEALDSVDVPITVLVCRCRVPCAFSGSSADNSRIQRGCAYPM